MTWQMEILVGAEFSRSTAAVLYVEGGRWQPIKPACEFPNVNLPPYRYGLKADAEAMLERLHPTLPKECKRVVRI